MLEAARMADGAGDVRPRHGRAGPDRRHGRELRAAAEHPRRRLPVHRAASGREAQRGALRRRRGARCRPRTRGSRWRRPPMRRPGSGPGLQRPVRRADHNRPDEVRRPPARPGAGVLRHGPGAAPALAGASPSTPTTTERARLAPRIDRRDHAPPSASSTAPCPQDGVRRPSLAAGRPRRARGAGSSGRGRGPRRSARGAAGLPPQVEDGAALQRRRRDHARRSGPT